MYGEDIDEIQDDIYEGISKEQIIKKLHKVNMINKIVRIVAIVTLLFFGAGVIILFLERIIR